MLPSLYVITSSPREFISLLTTPTPSVPFVPDVYKRQALNECRKRNAKHYYHRREEHLVAAARNLHKYAEGYKYESAQKLVCRTEQRPDVCLSLIHI